MKVIVDDKDGYVSFIFAPSHQDEAKRVLKFAIKMYRDEGCDVSDIETVSTLLEAKFYTIQ